MRSAAFALVHRTRQTEKSRCLFAGGSAFGGVPAVLFGIFAELSAVSGRFLFVCGALLLFGNIAFGDGTYQRTKDGKTIVWNNDPKPGDEASWSGGRDREGYARGFGTLTWYTAEQEPGSAKPALYARYWGNTVRGKLNGPVNVHSKRKTDHATFADGVRTTRWAAGTAPSRRAAQQPATVAKQTTVPEPEAPAEGSRSPRQPDRTGQGVAKINPQPSTLNAPPETQDNAEFSTLNSQSPTIASDIDNSLRLLVWPPRHLRTKRVSANTQAASPVATARLTKEEVVDLADAAARSRGYDLAEYQRSEPQYDPADQTWSLLYSEKPVDGTAKNGTHFSVAVGDKTKGTALVAGK